jgi:cytochrome c peroxidase
MVKITSIITPPVAAFIIFIPVFFLHVERRSFSSDVDKHYQQQLETCKEKLNFFRDACRKRSARSTLTTQFYAARLAYKKLAVITEYFNRYETFSLNNPALERVEDGHPDEIIAPAGFQAIEQLLFSSRDNHAASRMALLATDMLTVIGRLENETDRIYKFRKELVWDAARSALLRVMTTGITGFDSPLAQYSLTEAKASLGGVYELLGLFRKNTTQKEQAVFAPLFTGIKKSEDYLDSHSSFNNFDRLSFITLYLDPLYKELVAARVKLTIGIPEGANPVNFDAVSIFATDAFNISFYSPGQEYAPTPQRIKLGRKLFSDPLLSGDGSRSCASCHQPEKAFTDGRKTALGIDNKTALTRNTPTLLNSALQTKQFYDSRADILENQLDEVVHNAAEMKGSLGKNVGELEKSPEYRALFHDAYPGRQDPVSPSTIANAISSYLRSLVMLDSRFDQYMRGDKRKMNAAEKNGFNLFAGKAKCATCHYIPLFNGLAPPVFTETESEVLGVPKTTDKNPAELDDDLGKYLFTRSVIHKYSFKTPTLRNIELTAPYMHNGVYRTLEEVIEFYDKGGGKGLHIAPVNQTLPFDKLALGKKEKADLIAFMKTLTDTVYQSR